MKMKLSNASFLVLCIQVSGWALARAGGGGGYSGGGGGGYSGGGGGSYGGGSGGGEALGELLYWYVRMHFHAPIPMLILDAFVFVLIYHTRKSTDSIWSESPSAKDWKIGLAAAANEGEEIATLRDRDPRFDEGSFRRRVEKSFLAIQSAWSDRDLTRVQHLMSDGVFERFRILLKILEKKNLHNVMQSTAVHGVKFYDVQSDNHYDTVHLLIEASAVDQYLDVRTKRVVRGSGSRQKFSEIWTLSRKRGVATSSSGSLADNTCPNCGAMIKLTNKGQCSACEALVISGQYDWILTEITQISALTRSGRKVAGLNTFKKKDPEFCVASLEDHASVTFWRLREAELNQSNHALVRFVRAGNLERIRKLSRLNRRTKELDPAVGMVDLVKLDTDVDGRDLAYVRVKWTGQWGDSGTHNDHLLTFSRDTNVSSNADYHFGSLHCLSCGGPDTDKMAADCSWCGAKLNEGRAGWVLQDVELYTGRVGVKRKGVRNKKHRGVDKEDLIVAAIALTSKSDQSEDDYRKLIKFAREHRITEAHLIGLSTIYHNGHSFEDRFYTEKHRIRFLAEFFNLCVADRNISDIEEELLLRLESLARVSGFDMPGKIESARQMLENGDKPDSRDLTANA